jgi:hypothetical protein
MNIQRIGTNLTLYLIVELKNKARACKTSDRPNSESQSIQDYQIN